MYEIDEVFEPLVSLDDFDKAGEIMKERAEKMPNKNPKLTAFSGITRCGQCGCSVSRRSPKAGKKWVCNTKERKHTCDFRDINESELEALAAKALGLDSYDEEVAKKQIKGIVIDNAEVFFLLNNGSHKFPRTYGSYSGFSKKLYCGACGHMLVADSDRKQKIWECRNCHAAPVTDTVIRSAAQSVLGNKNYEGVFARDMEKAIHYPDRIDFYFKEGTVVTWQKR
jgi:hypothetical protein